MKKRKVIEPSQLGRRRRRRRNLRLLLWILLILVVFGGIVAISHLPQFSIDNVKLEGNTFSSTNNILHTAEDDLSGDYFKLFSKSNIFIFPKRKIESDILAQYPPIKSISIKRSSLKEIQITVLERKQQFLWCRLDQCYFMDSSGFIFNVAPAFSTDLYFTYYGLIELENPVGQNYLSLDKFDGVVRFVNNVKKLGISTDYVKATDNNNFELHLLSGGKILFNTNQPLDETISNLQTVTDKNNASGTSVDLSKIEYLDLRFGNKVFYKLTGATVATSTQSN